MRRFRFGRIGVVFAGIGLAVCLAGATAAAQPLKLKPKAQASPRPAAPSSVEVVVVQVAGKDVYLQPGANGGVRRGARVVIGQREYTVVQASDSFAVIEAGDAQPPHEQDKGQASVVSVEEDKPKELRKPQPLSKWESAWTRAEPPASSQTPRFVPLGTGERDRRWDLRISMMAGGIVPLGSRGTGVEVAELNALMHAEPFDAATTLDLDVSLQQWLAADLSTRAGGVARPTIWLRELLLGHTARSWYAGFGRMRYAASTLGPLDGVKVRMPVGSGLTVGAFGGVLPNPLSGEPSLSAQRFGVEATYSRPETELRPEAALVVHGSTFGGALDERRISGTFGIYPGLSRVGGYFEVSNFDANNPWNAPTVALTAAGLDGSVHIGFLQVGARLDLRQPERSRWLASFLPTTWFCRTVASATGGNSCDGTQSTPAIAAVDASVAVQNVLLTVGGTTTHDLTQPNAPDMVGMFAAGRVVRLVKTLRLDASASYSQATYASTVQGSAGPGLTVLGDTVDVGAYYRAASVTYRFTSTALLQQGTGLVVGIFPSGDVLFTLQGEATVGNDTRAMMLFGTAMWRPRL
jgi:hypothetical protein